MNRVTTPIQRRSRTPFSVRLMAACLTVTLASLAWSQSLEVIQLRHRTAAEVMPALQPLVESGGALSGQDYQLFARVSKANLAQLKQALASLDRQQKQLLISVRNSTREELEREQIAARGQLSTQGGSASVTATHANEDRARDGTSSVRVLEGGTASIATGQSVPIVTSVFVGRGRRPGAAASLDYRDLSSGYLVTPRLAGERVTLQIDQQSQQAGNARPGTNGNITTQSLSTQVSGRLGEWIALGGVDESRTSNNNGALSRSYETQSSNRAIWVKVETVD